MLKKLSFFIILAIFLSACGAPASGSATEEITNPVGNTVMANSHGLETFPDMFKIGEAESVHKPEYFQFKRTMVTRKDEAGMELLYEQYYEVDFTAEDPKREEWVSQVLESLQTEFATNSSYLYDYAKEFIADYGKELFYTNSNYQMLSIPRHDDSFISLVCFNSLYSGGAHPSAIQTAYNLDMHEARLLRLEDILTAGGAKALLKMVQEDVHEQFASLGETALFPEYRQTIDNAFSCESMTPYWYLNNEGLVVFFNQYELGPYAAGIIRSVFPYEELDGILRQEYFPPQGDGSSGDLIARKSWNGNTIPITIELDGEQMLIGVEGMVHQVQLSEVRWLDNTPIAQELIFSAKSLCQEDVLQVTGGFDQESKSFCIEFYDGAGVEQVYYLTNEGLSKEP